MTPLLCGRGHGSDGRAAMAPLITTACHQTGSRRLDLQHDMMRVLLRQHPAIICRAVFGPFGSELCWRPPGNDMLGLCHHCSSARSCVAAASQEAGAPQCAAPGKVSQLTACMGTARLTSTVWDQSCRFSAFVSVQPGTWACSRTLCAFVLCCPTLVRP